MKTPIPVKGAELYLAHKFELDAEHAYNKTRLQTPFKELLEQWFGFC